MAVWFADFGIAGSATGPLGLREQLIAKQTTAYSRCVAPPGVAESEFNLLPSRYLTVHDGEDLEAKVLSSRTVRLGDIATLIRPSHVRDADDGTSEFQEVQLQDLPQGGHIREARPIAVRTDVQRRALTQVLQPNDILASSKGTIGRIGIVPVALLPGTRWLASSLRHHSTQQRRADQRTVSLHVFALGHRTSLAEEAGRRWDRAPHTGC